MKSAMQILMATLLFSAAAMAQVREIRATGEYVMGDNDTKADAKKLALLDAKRKVLEQAGTYISTSTEVRNFEVTKDQIDAYSAGIMEVVEQDSRTVTEGNSITVRVDVLIRINTQDVLRRIDELRKNPAASDQMLDMQKQVKELQKQLQSQSQQIAALKSDADINRAAEQRRQAMSKVDSRELLAQAWAAMSGSNSIVRIGDASTSGREKAKALAAQAMDADPSLAAPHDMMASVFLEERKYADAERESRAGLRLAPTALGHTHLALALQYQGRLNEAVDEYRAAIRMDPRHEVPHYDLGVALEKMGNLPAAADEYRQALYLNPSFAAAHYNFADALFHLGDRQRAAYEFREYLRLIGNNPSFADKIEYSRRILSQIEGR